MATASDGKQSQVHPRTHAPTYMDTHKEEKAPVLKVQLYQTATVGLLFGVKFLHQPVGAGRHLTTITMVTE